jgi:hypothetical protein
MSTIIYCTYLTVYTGNKLPPYYIGSSTIDKINNGYRGSVQSKKYKKIWREELRINPLLFSTFIISKHATREECLLREEDLQRKLNVVENPLYINLCIAGKLFADNKGIKRSEETKKRISENHWGMSGKKHSEETKRLMSIKARGNTNPLGHKHSEETKKKISSSTKGKKRSEECKRKQSLRLKGSIPWNKGIPHSDTTKYKLSEKAKLRPKRKWINNGEVETHLDEGRQIPAGYVFGRIKK